MLREARLGPQRHLHRIGQLVDAGQHRGTTVYAKADLFGSVPARSLELRKRLREDGAYRFTMIICMAQPAIVPLFHPLVSSLT